MRCPNVVVLLGPVQVAPPRLAKSDRIQGFEVFPGPSGIGRIVVVRWSRM